MLTQARAVKLINENQMLLVFPVQNRAEPPSLWSKAYPKTKMRWEWDAGGDNRVANLWILREELSRSEKVIYTKWLSGRATFFSRDLFVNFLAVTHHLYGGNPDCDLSFDAREVLDLLESDSPLSTKQLKRGADLQGRDNEPRYNRALKQLWNRFLIVGFGEVDEGAFPSLAIGATRVLFEDLYREAKKKKYAVAQAELDAFFLTAPWAARYWKRTLPRADASDAGSDAAE